MEVGAGWLHGGASPKHSVAGLFRAAGLPLQRSDARDLASFALFDTAGRRVPDDAAVLVQELFESVEGVMEGRGSDLPLLTGLRATEPSRFERLFASGVVDGFGLPLVEAFYGAPASKVALGAGGDGVGVADVGIPAVPALCPGRPGGPGSERRGRLG